MSIEADRALLRRFEPVIHYTRGERFFPMDVDPYVRACSLWMQSPEQEPICVIPEGQLDLEKINQDFQSTFGTIYFLKFIEPLNISELAAYKIKQGLKKKTSQEVFRAGRGRLARVGYVSRFLDALFSLTLLARGRVPGDTAAAAAQAYQEMMLQDERYCYYGRVIRQNGWTALQYWFFYPFNNWRSGFFGANDHEADWEMIYLYVSEGKNGGAVPEWVAYASHDFSGDDLRRRWDDPEVEKYGDHPIIYAGAGSHASYYAPGEYLAELEMPFLSPLVRLVDYLQEGWRKFLHQTQINPNHTDARPSFNIFRVPFVDYARGDGICIGPGGEKSWEEPHLLEPTPGWAIQYHGLWGLYANDPVAGENAPAGPVYNRDGKTRRSWYDPIGWAGLDKVPPPDKALDVIREEFEQIETRQALRAERLAEKGEALIALGVEAEAMVGLPHMAQLHAEHLKQIATLSEEIKNLRAQSAAENDIIKSLQDYAERLKQGEPGPARNHIRHAQHPASDEGLRLGRLAETWSAISIGLMILGFVGILLFARHYLLLGLVGMISFIVFVEASFRRQVERLISSLTIGLALVATFILIYEFFWTIVVAGVILSGFYIMWENIRELYA
jgi:hypothetical protein